MIVYKVVKQCKGEWKLVMEKLAKVGSVVVNVGNMCRNHGLKIEELPSDLLAIFGYFRRCLFPLLNMSWSNPNQATCTGLMPRWKNVLKWKESRCSFFVMICWRRSSKIVEDSSSIPGLSEVPLSLSLIQNVFAGQPEFFVLLPQLTQQFNRLDLSNQELEGQ